MNEAVNNLIKNEIEQNDVCLFMKGTPDAPSMRFFNGNLKYVKNFGGEF